MNVALSALMLLAATPEGDAARQIQAFLTAELADAGVEVLSHADVRRIMGLAQERAVFGCGDDDGCLAKVGVGLDVQFLVTAHLSRAGEELILLLALINTHTGQTVARNIASAPDIGSLLNGLDQAARTLAAAALRGGAPAKALVLNVRVDKGVLRAPPVVAVAVDDRAARAAELGRALTVSLTAQLDERSELEVVSRQDTMRALGDVDDADACLEDAACMEDVAGALDARQVVLAEVGSLDGIPVVSLTVLEVGEARASQRLANKSAALEDVEGTLGALAKRAQVSGRVLVSSVEVDPAVIPLAGDELQLGPLPMAAVQLGAGVAAVGLLSCVPGLNCVAFPLVPGIGALLQVYLGNTLGKRRARIFWPVVAGYLAWLPVFGALPVLSLAATALQNLIAPTSATAEGDNVVGAAVTFLLPLALMLVAGVVSQAAVTAAFALGARHPRTDVDELGVDVASAPFRAPRRARSRLAMAY